MSLKWHHLLVRKNIWSVEEKKYVLEKEEKIIKYGSRLVFRGEIKFRVVSKSDMIHHIHLL